MTEEIASIFRPGSWEGVTNDEFTRYLSVPLRLATEMLRTDRAAEYFVTLADGDLYLSKNSKQLARGRKIRDVATEGFIDDQASRGVSWPSKWPVYMLAFPNRDSAKNADFVKARAHEVLASMAEMVQFEVLSTKQQGRSSQGSAANGITIPVEGPLPGHLFHAHPNGCMSRVRISKDNLMHLIETTNLCESPENKNKDMEVDMVTLRWQQFLTAVTIVHELGHAFQNAYHGLSVCSEVFYKNSSVCEAGYDLVAQILGGLPNILTFYNTWSPHQEDPCGSSTAMCIVEWPSPFYTTTYDMVKADYGTRTEPLTTEHLWRLPISLVVSLFTKSFWDNHHANFRSSPVLLYHDLPRWLFRLSGKDLEAQIAQRELVDAGQHHCCKSSLTLYPCEVDDSDNDQVLKLPPGALWAIAKRSKRRVLKAMEDILESSMPLEAMLQVVQERRRKKRKSKIPKDLDRPTLRAGFPYANEQLSPLVKTKVKGK